MIVLSEGLEDVMDMSPFLVAGVALVLFAGAQTFINGMLEGDQGLGAFLKDGPGYNRSGYKKNARRDEKEKSDPLPWLKLPKFDFVEVAGQTSQQENLVFEKLDSLRLDMKQKLDKGNLTEATAIREELEALMRANDIEYKKEE